jgi:hypothetical protein
MSVYCAHLAAADVPSVEVTTAGGCKIFAAPPYPEVVWKWQGDCSGGFASGRGSLVLTFKGTQQETSTGVMHGGKRTGEWLLERYVSSVALRLEPTKFTYTATFTAGVMNRATVRLVSAPPSLNSGEPKVLLQRTLDKLRGIEPIPLSDFEVQLQNGFLMSAGYVTTVAELTATNKRLPTTAEVSSLKSQPSPAYIESISVLDKGVIQIKYPRAVAGGGTILRIPALKGNSVLTWTCQNTFAPEAQKYVPSSCKR